MNHTDYWASTKKNLKGYIESYPLSKEYKETNVPIIIPCPSPTMILVLGHPPYSNKIHCKHKDKFYIFQ